MPLTKTIDSTFTESPILSAEGIFSGYASVFGVRDSHGDVIESGAFVRCLGEKEAKDIKLLWQHKMDEPIGVCCAVAERADGLWLEAQLLLEVQRAYEAYVLLKHKAIMGLSIGFLAREYHYDTSRSVRYITDVELLEISLVTFPSNHAACVSVVKSDYGEEKDDVFLLMAALDAAIFSLYD